MVFGMPASVTPTTPGAPSCDICGGRCEPAVAATERMLGLGGEFRYELCRSCGCLRLVERPPDLARYYGAGYYAFFDSARSSLPARLLRFAKDDLRFGRTRRLGALLAPMLPERVMEAGSWLMRAGASRRSRVLDVGCGAGALLQRLADVGYHQAVGVDPFVPADVVHRGRILVRKGTIHDMDGPFDLIMFHHSLEHIADQRGVMAQAAELLVPGGCCLIRIPTVSSAAWEEYGDRWVQLDAPRHFYLHSLRSIGLLAEAVGLHVERIVFDSTRFQFEGSELYRQDRPLTELSPETFSRRRRREFSRQARRLNAARRGDQAAFYLRKR